MKTTRSRPLRIGILGAANIARAFTRDVSSSRRVEVAAVASRTPMAARQFAAENGISRCHGSYEALLADPAIDIVYLPLPNSLHASWAMAAAATGKHVLCEKPLALDGHQARAMFEVARRHGVMLLEAYPYWFQPQTRTMLDLVHGGALGRLEFIQASFGFTLPDGANNIRLDASLGGGALLDAGSYPLSLIRLLMGEAPARVSAVATWAASGVDMSLMAQLEWADGRRAQLSCSMAQGMHRHATIVGREGTLTTEYQNHTAEPGLPHPFGFQPSLLRVRRSRFGNVPFETVVSPAGSGFRFAAEAFAQVIRTQDHAAIERAARASIDIADTLAALGESARTARPVTLANVRAG